MSLKTAMFFNMGLPLEDETKAILQRATGLGITVPVNIQRYINDVIIGFKLEGVWSAANCYFKFSWGNLELDNFSLIDWKTPAGPLAVKHGAVLYTLNGYEGNGVDAYIDTMHAPATFGGPYTQNSAMRAVTVYKAATIGNVLEGSKNGQNQMRNINSNQHRINSGNITPGADLSGTGKKAICRDSATNVRVYNKQVETLSTAASVAVPTLSYDALRSSTQYCNAGISDYMLGGTMTAAKILKIREIDNQLFTALGLQPVS